MNILFLALDVDLRISRGDSIHVRELCSQLVAIGHHVRLVTATKNLHDLPGVTHWERPSTTLAQIQQVMRLAKPWAHVLYERRLSPKVSWTISRLAGIPFVVEANGVLEDELADAHAPEASIRRMLKTRARNFMLKSSSGVVAVSEDIREQLTTRCGVPTWLVEVVPNGANTEEFRPLGCFESRKRLSIPEGDPVICFVGNLAPWQGVDFLIQACAILRKDNTAVSAVVVGTGPEAGELRTLAKQLGVADFIRFAGAVDYKEVPHFMNAADVCVAPFRKSRKASPIKVFEYLACGKPVVTSDIDDIGEFVRTCGGGIVVEPEDPQSLARAILWLVLRPADAKLMGERGRAAVLSSRSWHDTARRVSDILQSVASGAGEK